MPFRQQPLPRFRLLRYFSVASLLAILVVAIIIIGSYRYVVTSTISHIGTSLDLSVARIALKTLDEDLRSVLARHDISSTERPSLIFDKSPLAKKISDLVDGTGIVKIKFYSPNGTVLYSTNPEQIGNNQIDNPGFTTAMKGRPASKFIYQDHLNPFDNETSDDNLIQTYLPIISKDSRRPIGVFEVYSDANDIIHDAAYFEILMLPIILIILSALYVSLLIVVRIANNTLEDQDRTIFERTQTLELLSAKLMKAQEDERKRVAEVLHESVAQSLMAVELRIENRGDKLDKGVISPLLRDALNRVRELAIELRPPSLDDFGAIEALSSFFRQLLELNADRSLSWDFEINESDLPKPLKTIVFRIAQDTLRNIYNDTEADKIGVSLGRVGRNIVLTISENTYAYHSSDPNIDSDKNTNSAVISMRERTILSGGQFTTKQITEGTTENISAWPA